MRKIRSSSVASFHWDRSRRRSGLSWGPPLRRSLIVSGFVCVCVGFERKNELFVRLVWWICQKLILFSGSFPSLTCGVSFPPKLHGIVPANSGGNVADFSVKFDPTTKRRKVGHLQCTKNAPPVILRLQVGKISSKGGNSRESPTPHRVKPNCRRFATSQRPLLANEGVCRNGAGLFFVLLSYLRRWWPLPVGRRCCAFCFPLGDPISALGS